MAIPGQNMDFDWLANLPATWDEARSRTEIRQALSGIDESDPDSLDRAARALLRSGRDKSISLGINLSTLAQKRREYQTLEEGSRLARGVLGGGLTSAPSPNRPAGGVSPVSAGGGESPGEEQSADPVFTFPKYVNPENVLGAPAKYETADLPLPPGGVTMSGQPESRPKPFQMAEARTPGPQMGETRPAIPGPQTSNTERQRQLEQLRAIQSLPMRPEIQEAVKSKIEHLERLETEERTETRALGRENRTEQRQIEKETREAARKKEEEAGKPSTVGAETAAREEAKAFAEQYVGIESANNAADNVINTTSRMQKVLEDPKFISGAFSTHINTALSRANTLATAAEQVLGPNTPEMLKTVKEETGHRVKLINDFNASRNALVYDMAHGKLSQGFTDKDRDFVSSIIGGEETSVEANKALVKVAQEKAKYDKELTKVARDYKEKAKDPTLRGLNEALDDYKTKHPLFSNPDGSLTKLGEEIDRIGKVGSKPSAPSGGATDLKKKYGLE